MSEIRFHYNKYSEFMLYFMIVLSIILGFFVYAIILYCLGILSTPQYTPEYFNRHPQHAVYIIFGLIPIFMLFPAWIAAKIWGSKDEEGSIHLYENFAVLYYRNQEIKINKGELSIKFMAPCLHWYVLYILKMPQKKIKLCSSVIKWKKDKHKRFALSLDIAMDKLMYYQKANTKKSKEAEKNSLYFYELEILIGINTPQIFDSTQYYVDYDSIITVPEGKFATCLIRERENPIHVVGDLEIDISLLKIDEIDEKNLKKQLILAVIELDEQVELYD